MELVASQIAAAVNVRSLYPPNHPRVAQSVTELAGALAEALAQSGGDEITFVLIGDDLLIGDHLIRSYAFVLVGEFVRLLEQRHIERLTLSAAVEPDELHRFIGALVTGEGLVSTSHITLGHVQLVMGEERSAETRSELSVQQLEIARAAWARFRVERRLPIEQLEDLVWSLIDSLARSARGVLPLAGLKSHDEYTFVHSVNVALLVLAQARSFGIEGSMLHEFGMAALLHDIGKLGIPVAVLNKPGILNEEEWNVMRTHPAEGARSLTAMSNAPALAIVVAFEHHLRHDGRPNYPTLRAPRMPNLASRMTAIADAFDAMSTVRPYQTPLGRAAACELLRKRAGSFYDPPLVTNFLRMIGEERSPADPAPSDGRTLDPGGAAFHKR
jgi:HD-GYP domain-containing protein (c-di-GMP phosphodiesterase class II)